MLEDGTVELIVDGAMYWRSPHRLTARPEALRVALGSQSLATRIAHGALAVYAEPRYRLPELSAEER